MLEGDGGSLPMRGPEGDDLYGFSYLNLCEKEVVRLGTASILRRVDVRLIFINKGPVLDDNGCELWPLRVTEQCSPGLAGPRVQTERDVANH